MGNRQDIRQPLCGGRGVRDHMVVGAELQFEVMKKFWGCWRWMDAGDDTIILKENRKKTNNPKQLQGFAQNTARILQMVGQRKARRGGGTKEREEAGNGRGRRGRERRAWEPMALRDLHASH